MTKLEPHMVPASLPPEHRESFERGFKAGCYAVARRLAMSMPYGQPVNVTFAQLMGEICEDLVPPHER